MHVYQVVFEHESKGSLNVDNKITERSEYIVAADFKAVYEKIQIQIDDKNRLIGILQRFPVIAVVEKG